MLTEALWGLATAGGTAMAGAVATDVWRSARLRFAGRHGQGESARRRGATAGGEAARGKPAPAKAEQVTAEQVTAEQVTAEQVIATRDKPERVETAQIETARVEGETVETARVGSGRVGRAAADIAGAGTAEREPGHRLGSRSRSRQSSLQHNIARDGGTQHITLSGDLNVHVNVGREARGPR
ncbi:hypothetical protein AB0E04_16590 [Streptomyces sp. NPDC048251]|uniref:hypothetical protein n=1 Tax=Streptomyces sp. NPDC048251 TaxID=3154501 RepID=UPI0034287268